MPHQINQEICLGCGHCEPQCPVEAISENEDKYQINNEECVDCQTCWRVCSVKAPSGGPKLNKKLVLK